MVRPLASCVLSIEPGAMAAPGDNKMDLSSD